MFLVSAQKASEILQSYTIFFYTQNLLETPNISGGNKEVRMGVIFQGQIQIKISQKYNSCENQNNSITNHCETIGM